MPLLGRAFVGQSKLEQSGSARRELRKVNTSPNRRKSI